MNYTQFITKIEKNEPFSFIRFGDTEWDIALGNEQHKNCDGNNYHDSLKRMLLETLKHPLFDLTFYYGLQGLSKRLGLFEKCTEKHEHIIWHNSDILHYANRDGELYPFVKLLNERPSILVSPFYMTKIAIDFNYRILTPEIDSFIELDRISNDVEKTIKRYKNPIVCFAVGATSNVLIFNLHKLFPNSCWFIDIGSIFDPYVDKGKSRSYFKNLTPGIKKRNLYEK